MKKTEIKGIIPPIVTPMNADETVNYQELRKQINRQIDAGVHGIFVYGTNGEFFALTTEEKLRVLEVAVEETAGRVPVYAGTGCITTQETVELSKKAEELGADVLSIITPYFAAASQDELYTHYMKVAEAVDLPIVLYNIPPRAGNAIAPATVARLARDAENIVGAKDSSGNFDNLKQYIDVTSDLDKDFSVLAGNDNMILPALVFGGKGGIAGRANVFPHTMVEIYEAFVAGDLKRAMKAQDSVRALGDVLKMGNPNTLVKKAANMVGQPVGPCRAPFNTISAAAMTQLEKVLTDAAAKGMN